MSRKFFDGPPAGDRYPGSADVLVGTRFTPARPVALRFAGRSNPFTHLRERRQVRRAKTSRGPGSCVPRGRGWTRAPRGRGWTMWAAWPRCGKQPRRGCVPDYAATHTRCGNQGVPRQPQYSCVPECRGRPLCLPIRIAPAHPPIPWRSRSGCRGRPPCLPIRIVPVATLKKGRHTVHPRQTGCTAFCRTVQPVHSSPPARASAPRLNLSSSDPCAPW